MKSPNKMNQHSNSDVQSIDRLSVPDMQEIEGSVHEMKGKNFNYWLTKAVFFFRSLQGSSGPKGKKRRKASYESYFGSSYDGDFDSEDAHVRIKPEPLDNLCQMTKFTRKELQYMYRGFKQECPSGLVKEETFKMIYSQFFPRSDSHLYAHYIFNTFDPNHTGVITFTDFVVGLSALARGTAQDKLRWAFSLYDLDGDGVLSRDELYRIIWSIYDLLGRNDPYVDESSARTQADTIFKRLDINKDGVITIEEFLDSCLRDENITQSLAVFNTIL